MNERLLVCHVHQLFSSHFDGFFGSSTSDFETSSQTKMPTNRPLIEHPWSLTWLRIKLVSERSSIFEASTTCWLADPQPSFYAGRKPDEIFRSPSSEMGRIHQTSHATFRYSNQLS